MSDELGGIINGASAAVTLAKDGITAIDALRRVGLARATNRRARDDFMRALGLSESGLATYWMSSDHPTIAHDQAPAADIDALVGLLGRDILQAISESNFPRSMREPEAALEHDLILIGSPESEAMTRLLFGYSDAPDGLGVRRTRDTLPLFYLWHEERRTGPTTLCLHVRPGGHVAARPNWPLCWVQDGQISKIRVRLRDGYLAEDYLIITVMPNFVSEASLESGARIASFAGLHSIGTRAVRSLLLPEHADVLHDLMERIRALPATRQGLQAVIHVDDVSHADKQNGSRGTSLRVHDVVPLYFSERLLFTARDDLSEAVPTWSRSRASRELRSRQQRVGFDLAPPFTPDDQRLVDLVATQVPIDVDRIRDE